MNTARGALAGTLRPLQAALQIGREGISTFNIYYITEWAKVKRILTPADNAEPARTSRECPAQPHSKIGADNPQSKASCPLQPPMAEAPEALDEAGGAMVACALWRCHTMPGMLASLRTPRPAYYLFLGLQVLQHPAQPRRSYRPQNSQLPGARGQTPARGGHNIPPRPAQR